MTTFHVSKFGGTSTSTLGYSINKQFTPDLDIRTVGYWDATRADKQTVVTGTGGIPKLTVLAGVVGGNLTTMATGRSPSSQNASGELGIVWRSDSASEGHQAMKLPSGILKNAVGVLLGFVFSQQSQSSISRFFELSKDGTSGGVTASSTFSLFGAPNNYTLSTSKLSSSNLNIPNLPTDNSLNCIIFHYKTDGTVVARLNGVEISTQTALALQALLPANGAGFIGGSYDGGVAILPASNTRITHIAIAELGAIHSKSDGSLTDVERDRNAAEYWEACLMYAANIQSKLPNGHTFKNNMPVTTWLGERT